jgi:membrane protein
MAQDAARLRGELGREGRIGRAWRRTGQLIEHGVSNFFRDACTQRAAAISFYALFSIFPLAILCVAVVGIIANDETARNSVVNFLLDRLPLSEDKGGRQIEHALRHVTSQGTSLGIVGTVTLVIAASNVMASIRQALNLAFGINDDRPPVQAKLWDIFGVFVFGVLVTLSFALTLADAAFAKATKTADDLIPGAGGVIADALVNAGRIVPLLLAVLLFAGIYRFVPAERPRLRDIWPGVLLAAIGYEVAKAGFTLYLSRFADYGTVYASLGAVVAFLVFTYIVAFVALLGAEFAAEWPRVRAGEYDGGPSQPFHREIWGFVKGLFVRAKR